MTIRHAAAVLVATLLLAGCVSVDVGNSDGGVQAQYRLEDLAGKSGAADARVARSLVVAAVPSVGIGDTFSLAYSRAPQQRALYQYASWADRPSSRIVQLLTRRIEERGAFATVSELGRGVAGELTLNIAVDELVHDVAGRQGRLHVTAELVDRSGRTLVARRRFEAGAPVAQENAQGAVQALSRALTSILDELVPWLEASAARAPATASR